MHRLLVSHHCLSTRVRAGLAVVLLSVAAAHAPHGYGAGSDGGDRDWSLHGLDHGETRYSPLADISRSNVHSLGLAWEAGLDSDRGVQATPIVVDGVMYVTGSWSRVFALDARTGERLWRFDPQVPGGRARFGCCDVINRGVAVHGGRVFTASFDGRLFALDASSGEIIWQVQTTDPEQPYTITGAPRLAGDNVVIGNAGAEFNVRGYVSAYDRETGELRWRFYTVPGSAEGPHEHPELEMAAATWDPESRWDLGGGGTVWDSMVYDPDLHILYVGTGNGAPWPRFIRSPAGGDNLFLASILALDPDTGRLIWHYQTTPGDSWDYTATQHILLADIEWMGEPRKVLFQAPKNGFFYVIDRVTGELLSADKFVRVTWATHVDLQTGRPVLSEVSDYSERGQVIFPSSLGGHNWHPMSFSTDTGLVYIPAQEAASHFSPDRFTVLLGSQHEDDFEHLVPEPMLGFATLLAWDPKARAVRWSAPHRTMSNAGVLSTAGGLVFQGDGEGFFNIRDAETGELLHRFETGVGIIAPPITYRLDGVQYVSVAAGWGGALFAHAESPIAARRYENTGRVLTFALNADGSLQKPPAVEREIPLPDGNRARALNDEERAGRILYVYHCGGCHGWFGHTGLLPDLRRSRPEVIQNLELFVLDGVLEASGMPAFADVLDADDVEQLKKYLRAVRLEQASGLQP